MNIVSHPSVTAQRRSDLAAYTEANVLDDSGFHCIKESSCRTDALFRRDGLPRSGNRSFWAGQMSHVGLHYDTGAAGKPWRVMAVGMEVGRAQENITLEERRLQQQDAINVPFRSRRPHMKGTTSALRLAFGRDPGDDRDGEMITFQNDPVPRHVMECYALVNMRLCSAVRTGTTSSVGTTRMSENCLTHLAATVRILEPTLIILQSNAIRSVIASRFSGFEQFDANLPNVEFGDFAGVPTIVASFPHPYQQGANSHLEWGSSCSTPYLREVVTPSIRAAREFALG